MAVGDALRRLCEEVGWSYAVFWKAIGAADPVHLVWEDGCCGHVSCSAGSEAPEAGCELGTSVCTLVRKVMTSQIHVVGEGTIGRAAFTGNHQWIVHDPANDHNLRPEVSAEMNHQFAAGIQTIAIIPVLPRGVLQLGATSVVSSVLKTAISQENQTSRSDLIGSKKANEVHDPTDAIVQAVKNMDRRRLPDISNERSPPFLMDPAAESDLFDMFGSEFHHLCHNVDNDLTWKAAKPENSNRDVPEFSDHLGSSPAFNSVDDEFPYSGIFSLTDTDQLLDAVVSNANPGGKQISGDSASCKTSVTDIPSTSYCRLKEPKQSESSAPPLLIKNELAVSNFVKHPSFPEKAADGCLSQNNAIQKSQIRLWIESGQNLKCESASASNSKGVDTSSKASRKRSRPGENPKPRPKDRQLIQDRIKELRELVPNGAKCSIDALLEKTIKHMVFLQSVTKHADNLKDSNESKILGGENGPLKDYFEGGATWAFDVGSQSMTCPIIVEDLDRPRQMLVEMLCEDRGIFLEIADFIKGLGLTILRGVMEARKNKIWARFTVEANRDVTRMEIFLSLMRLLEPSYDGGGAGENPNNNIKMPLGIVQYPVIPVSGHLR
ncbi:Putative HLH DNA-binding domain superfamily protein [Zea mays]|uniref:Putative HLH DNA-binding domain superfamily protein n=1 Tax=Zea mays TaxID=4577 RepID=A0A1D6ITH1_MAIZE|nr:Putative HLH DNA-binding domain superfamily protein [Zea mays]AQK39366.1 Putative HLH DNA-binding domain superfamily protein [Zea mays]